MKYWRWIIGTIVVLLVLGAVAMGLLVQTFSQPVDPSTTATQKFVIPTGQSVQLIAQRLEQAGLIKNALFFRLTVKKLGLDGKLQAGSFELSPAYSPQKVAQTLIQGTEDVWITIPEGLRTEEIAEYIASYDLELFDSLDFISGAKGMEGTLFPDTYLVPKESTAKQILSLLNNTFEQKITSAFAQDITSSPHSLDELLIMASLIEREARQYGQMRHVSSILWNRVGIGMPLQVDATLQYVKGFSKDQQKWWAQPTREDKSIPSPYNTYLNPGLPPGPISNPGVQAFKAALNPLETNDFYYLHAPSGEMYFGSTLDEHNANVQRYLR
jgi:UPF0755 protein